MTASSHSAPGRSVRKKKGGGRKIGVVASGHLQSRSERDTGISFNVTAASLRYPPKRFALQDAALFIKITHKKTLVKIRPLSISKGTRRMDENPLTRSEWNHSALLVLPTKGVTLRKHTRRFHLPSLPFSGCTRTTQRHFTPLLLASTDLSSAKLLLHLINSTHRVR